MDNVTLILAALAASAASAVKDVAGQAIKDGYAGLKRLIIQKWGNETEATTLLENHEQEPEAAAPLVASKLKKLGLDQDTDILELAKALLKKADPDGSAQGKYRVTVTNSKNVQVGDRNKQDNK